MADDVQSKYLHTCGINTWELSSVTETRAVKFYDKNVITCVYCLTLEGEVATNYIFVRCLLLTSVSTCFGHHYAHLQENKGPVTAFGVLFWFCWMWLVAVVWRCVVGCQCV